MKFQLIHPWKGEETMLSFIDMRLFIDGKSLVLIFCILNLGFALHVVL